MLSAAACLLLLLSPTLTLGALYTNVSDIADLDAYDFVIVGGPYALPDYQKSIRELNTLRSWTWR